MSLSDQGSSCSTIRNALTARKLLSIWSKQLQAYSWHHWMSLYCAKHPLHENQGKLSQTWVFSEKQTDTLFTVKPSNIFTENNHTFGHVTHTNIERTSCRGLAFDTQLWKPISVPNMLNTHSNIVTKLFTFNLISLTLYDEGLNFSWWQRIIC